MFVLYSNGAITFGDAPGVYAARPIFFLNSSVTYKSGLGITEFRGRGDEIKMFPVSFKEFFNIYDGTKEDALNEYFIYGGLPLTVLTKTDNNKIKYLER